MQAASSTPMEGSDDCTEPEPEDSDTALHSPGALVGPLRDVFQGTYMAGSRPLMPAERDLRAEFFDLRIYLIRGVDLDGLLTPATSVEFFAMSLIARGQATWSQLYRLMRSLPRDANLRWKQDSPVAETLDAPHRVTMGAWNRGPLTGLHTTTRLYPWCTRAISAVVHTWDLAHPFTTVTMSLNVAAAPHRDKYNHASTDNLCLPCSVFQGGELFIEAADGATCLSIDGPRGHIISAQTATAFHPFSLHATLPWTGNRLLIIAYHIGMSHRLDSEDVMRLTAFGFNPRYLEPVDS